mgnify:CR=1 FL=1|jgi:hypothetical protein
MFIDYQIDHPPFTLEIYLKENPGVIYDAGSVILRAS